MRIEVFMAIATHWRVEVYAEGEHILSIEPEMVSGADMTEDYADTIRHCAAHLIGFVGSENPDDFLKQDA
jgi:hypothetical protein